MDRRRFCTTLITVSLAGAVRSVGAAQPVPLRIPVWIGDKGPFSFIVDTGASRTAIASHAVSALGGSWQPGEPVRVVTPAGSLDLPTIPVGTFRIGSQALAIQRLPVLPRQALAAADGLLGADAFAGRALRLDFAASRAELSATPEPALRGQVVPLRREAGGLLVVDATVGGRRVATLLDTGSLDSVASPALARGPARRHDTPLRGADGSLLDSSAASLPAVAIGKVRWPPGPVHRADLMPPPGLAAPADGAALLLGLDRLAVLAWLAVDYPRGLVSLSPRPGDRE